MKTTFDTAWEDWIATNIERNCNRQEMYEILVANNFCPTLIKSRLKLSTVEPYNVFNSKTKNDNISKVDIQATKTNPQNINVSEQVFLPSADAIDTDNKLQLYKIDNFLNSHECFELLSLIRGRLRKSTITNKSSELKDYRTSKTCDLSLIDHPLIDDIDQRICAALGFDASYSEPIQAQWYDIGEEFKPHTDYFEPNSQEFEVHAKYRGQRTWTFMLYLNNTLSGGATSFTRVNKVFKPKQGMAVIWNSLTPQGKENIESMHWGMPIEKGFKVILTKWFRLNGKGKRFIKTPNECLPAYTNEGFMKTRLPQSLFSKIYHAYQAQMIKTTSSNDKVITADDKAALVSDITPLNENLAQEIQQGLQPLVEAWFGHYLKLSKIEDIKNYKNAAVIQQQREDSNTSIVTAIINIDQSVNKPWPLVIYDHNYRKHEILLTPGDICFYEAAKLSHGRPEALDGVNFSQLRVHYQLT
ncbi:prolyl hydroxylase family protein [Colwelliaceae bacterium MEBiC 14330]